MNKKATLTYLIFNILLPGAGLAWFFNIKIAIQYVVSLFLLALFLIMLYAYSIISFQAFNYLAIGIGIIMLFLSLIYFFKNSAALSTLPRSKKIKSCVGLFILVSVFQFFGLNLTRKFFVWTVLSSNSQIESVLPKGSCGIIKRPDTNLKLNDPVAYFNPKSDEETIFIGLIKAIPGDTYSSRFDPNNSIKISNDEYFIEVETTGAGLDSNALGPIPKLKIIGKISDTSPSGANWVPFLFFNPVSCI
ncbi:MAG: hypothetical protein AB7I27_00085 [Bacteriovoracaceae bacterium]